MAALNAVNLLPLWFSFPIPPALASWPVSSDAGKGVRSHCFLPFTGLPSLLLEGIL